MEHSKEVEQNCSKIIALVIKALVELFLIKMGQCNTTDSCSNINFQGFPNYDREWDGGGGESEILLGGIFLLGKGNLRRSDFDDSNLFQS